MFIATKRHFLIYFSDNFEVLTLDSSAVKTGAKPQIAYHLRLDCLFIVWILDLCCLRLNKDLP